MTSKDISFLDLDIRSKSHVRVISHRRGGVYVLKMLLVFSVITSPRNRWGVIFSLQFVCVCVSVCLSVFLCVCLMSACEQKFQPNRCTDLDAVFAKWLLTPLSQALLILVTLSQRSRLQWRNIHFFFIILYSNQPAYGLCYWFYSCPVVIILTSL